MQLYKLSFPNGKEYIGITKHTAKERFRRHCESTSKKHPAQHAIHKFGKESVIIKVLATIDDWELLCLAEQEAIEKFNTMSPNGYNLTAGGDGSIGFRHSEESKIKMSESAKKKVLTEEHKQKLIDASKNRVYTDEDRAAISARYKGRKIPEWQRELLIKVNLGSKKSLETRAKISEKAKGRKISNETKQKISASSRNVIKQNKTGYTGVYQIKNGKYVARARFNSRKTSIGTFNTPEEASNAYQNFIKSLLA